MLADLLHQLFPYQIFRSVLFRAGMGYLTVYFLISLVMPFCVKIFRKKGFISDFRKPNDSSEIYSGQTPIMGGLILLLAIAFSSFLWCWFNEYTVILLATMGVFGLIGLVDDWHKIKNLKNQINNEQNSHRQQADGISGKLRLILEFAFTGVIMFILVVHLELIVPKLHIPGIPIKNFFPEIPVWLFILFGSLVIVGGANAVNLSDGLDTLASIPLLTSLLFVAVAAYIGGEQFWTERLKLIYLGEDMKQVAIIVTIIIGALICFLKYNSPPATIYLGDVGSLGLGAGVSLLFIFIKGELFLPIVGGSFVIAALSSIIQRVWFILMQKFKGREYAKKHRFFYRAPYHHHNQGKYNFHRPEIHSVYAKITDFFVPKQWPKIDKYASKDAINNKVIWHNHIKTIWFLVIALIIYFKVR